MNIIRKMGLGLVGAIALAALGGRAEAGQTLFEELGGKPAVTQVVGDFIGIVAADPRINGRFAKVNIPRLQMLIIEQLCAATGGGCTYTGRSMQEAHKGMNLREADFNALVEDLQAALDKDKVPFGLQNRLIAILAPLEGSVDRQ